jgi:hypothetical protein
MPTADLQAKLRLEFCFDLTRIDTWMPRAVLDNPGADRSRQLVRVTMPIVEKRPFAPLRVTRELHKTVGRCSSYGQICIGHRLLPGLAFEQTGNQL